MLRLDRLAQLLVLLVALSSSLVIALPTRSTFNLTASNVEVQRDLISPLAPLSQRDAFTDIRGTGDDRRLTSVGKRPAGSYARYLPVGPRGAKIFTWYSKTPNDESLAESAFIVVHGINRNANTYWSVLNKAYIAARDAGYASAAVNSVRVAPLFFSTDRDGAAYASDALAWGDSNRWTAGEASTHPPNSRVSSFSVLDSLLDRFADRRAYPNMRQITFVAHGGGAQFLQRYAVMGKSNPAPERLSVTYVVGDPSSMLYFTQDRPVGVDIGSCPAWNTYRYGVNGYSANYGQLNSHSSAGLFRRYAGRDVRYVVGMDDTDDSEGDQFCMARGLGGPMRRTRSLAYWKYIHLLSGRASATDDLDSFPGTFPTLDPTSAASAQSNIPRSRSHSSTAAFRGERVRHSLALISGVGHSVSAVYASDVGRHALFGSRGEASGGVVPASAARELDGYTASG